MGEAMKLWVVTMDAVYIHEVFGPFPTHEEAVRFADSEASHEREDGHHSYRVRELTVDGLGDESHDAHGERRALDYGSPRDAVSRRLPPKD